MLFAVGCVVLGEFAWRGPWRALHGNSQDLAVHQGAARAWASGGDPYDILQVGRGFVSGGGPRRLMPSGTTMPSVYPPITYLVEAPLAALGWDAAVRTFLVVSLSLVVVALVLLARAMALRGERAAWFAVGALALAPLQTGLAEAQVAMPAASLLITGWALSSTRPALSGLLLALGAAMKPSMAVPFILAAVARPRQRTLASAGASLAILSAVAEVRLVIGGHRGVEAWLSSVAAAFRGAGMNSPAPQNAASVTMVHLHMLLLRLVHAPGLAIAVSAAITFPLLTLGVLAMRRARSRRDEAIALSLLCVASLLGMYHRTYDAVLLWIPLAAFVAGWSALPRAARALTIGALAAFVVPGPAALAVLAHDGRLPRVVVDSVAWRTIVIPHQVWILLLVAVALAFSIVARTRRDEASRLDRTGERPAALLHHGSATGVD